MYLIGIFASPFPYLVLLSIYLTGFAWIKIQPAFSNGGITASESNSQYIVSEYFSVASSEDLVSYERGISQKDIENNTADNPPDPNVIFEYLAPFYSFFLSVYRLSGDRIRPPPSV